MDVPIQEAKWVEESGEMVQTIIRFRSILYASADAGKKVTMNRLRQGESSSHKVDLGDPFAFAESGRR